MRLRPKHVLALLLAIFLAGLAHGPVLSAGLLGPDYAALSGRVPPGSGPLAVGSLELWSSLFGLPGLGEDPGSAPWLRLPSLLALVAAAVSLGLFARRLLLPWTGSESARGAARAAAVLLLVHPFAPLAVLDLGAHGEVLALFLVLASGSAFLRGRQDRRTGAMVLALGLAILAGFAEDVALGLPFMLALAEVLSAHRYRPRRARLRTAVTTLVVFGTAVLVRPLFALVRGEPVSWPLLFGAEGASLAQRAEAFVGELGLLVLPSNPAVLGPLGFVLAGGAFLLSVQPALVAARSAPRLWGWKLVCLMAALIGSGLLHTHVDVRPESFGRASTLLSSAAVAAFALGLTSTALSGSRRPYVLAVAAAISAVLASANSRPAVALAREVTALRKDLRAARDEYRSETLFVLDAPSARAGFDPLGDSLVELADPARLGLSDVGEAGPVRSLSSSAFLALVPEPELDPVLASGLVVLAPLEELVAREDAQGARDRPFRRLAPRRASVGARSWQRQLDSPSLSLEPLVEGALVVRSSGGASAEKLGTLRWTNQGAETPAGGTLAGTAVPVGDEVEVVFDLASSLAWRLSGRVLRLSLGGVHQNADVRSALPALRLPAASPEVRNGDWRLRAPAASALEGAELAFGLLDLGSLTWHEFPVLRDEGEVRIPGVEDFVRDREGPFSWTLEYRVAGRAFARSRGRR